MSSRIEIEEEEEGERVGTNDFFFEKIGEPVPIKSQPDSQFFDLQTPPAQPLALSERFQLLFIAHSSGFLVARTKDVIDLAKNIKGTDTTSTIEDLSVVNVAIGKVQILALSSDESTLAVSVAADIRFFSVNSLLDKEINPCFSTAVPHPSSVKDIRWRRKKDEYFLVLSDDRKLYGGTVNNALKHLMDGVDAVEWSVKGGFAAVAKDNVLSILSSKFNEKLSLVLSFKSWIDDSGDDCVVKVDSIRWFRHDCIVIGCVQLSADGNEENYLFQVVKSKTGKITDASSTSDLVVLSFNDLFLGLVDDIVPSRTGPYLFLSYLEQYQLAIAAHKKNTDEHIVLLSWLLGENGEASVVEIGHDKWLPRIELQDNGDDNLIMGLCLDKVSVFGSMKVQLGVEEVKELSLFCVLICLTLEGKLILFNIAIDTENAVPPDVSSLSSDKEEDTPAVVPDKFDQPKLTYGQDATKQVFHKNDIQGSLSLKNSKSFEAVGQQKFPVSELYQEAGSQQSGQQGQFFLKTSQFEGPDNKVRDGSQTETQKVAGFGSFASTGGNSTLSHVNLESVPKNFELVKESVGKTGSTGFSSSFQSWTNPSSQPFSSGKFMVSEESDAKSLFSSTSHIQGNKFQSSAAVTVNSLSSSAGKPSLLKDAAAFNKFSGTPVESGSQISSIGAENIESVPLIRSLQLSSQSQLNIAPEKSLNQKPYSTKDDYKSANQSVMLKSEPHLSKKFSNIEEMVKELDTLLESIEETGGYRDACTVIERSSVEQLEQGLTILSEKFSIWKNIMDERLGKVQHLLDRTAQVFTRKQHIEGIVKQASDSRYWDLWNRQKLSSELELKQRRILELNQDLTNQLIELERHFNTFELHQFGDSDGVYAGRRALRSRFGSSRNMHSLHTLHSTMSSQLAAAEQLSEFLSQQMAMLSVESPVKQRNVKDELFQTIGLAHDASFTSPHVTKTSNISSAKKLVLSSGSTASRNQSSSLKSFEPEIARRRRDSLGQSWASFEPPKTTVKRMLLENSENVKRSSLVDKFSPCAPEETRLMSENFLAASIALNQSGKEVKTGIQDAFPKQDSESTLFRWANNSLVSPQNTGWKSSTVQTSSVSALSAISGSQPMMVQNSSGETCCNTVAKPNSGAFQVERSNISSFNERLDLNQEYSISQVALFPKKPTDIPNSDVKHVPSTTKSTFFGSSSNHDSQFMPPAAVSASPSFSVKVSQLKTLPSEKLLQPPTFSKPISDSASSVLSSPAPSFSSSFSMLPTSSFSSITKPVSASSSTTISSSAAPKFSFSTTFSMVSSSATGLSESMTSSTIGVGADKKASSSSSSPSVSFSAVVSSNSLSTLPLQMTVPSTEDSSPVSSTSEILKTEAQPLMEALQPKKDVVSVTQVSESPTGLSSGSQTSITDIASPAYNLVSNVQPVQPSTGNNLFSASLSTSIFTTNGKSGSLDVIAAQEDEMEEEALETNQMTELGLESLSNFGIGSSPNPGAPKSNPFGGPFGIVATSPATTIFTASIPSKELFRPASFSFQSPQPSQPYQPAGFGAFSGGFASSTPGQSPAQSAFGKPAQLGAGQQALGSVLGAFGQSRQIGTGLPGSGFGGGFASPQSAAGFSNAASGSGFASISSTSGGFAGLGSGGGFGAMASGGVGFGASGGFAGAASGGGTGGFSGAAPGVGTGGFAAAASGGGGGGFAGAAPGGGTGGFAAAAASGGGGFAGAGSGGGFGAFSNQQQPGGFSAFGGGVGQTGKPPEFFTQMRK